MWKHVLKNFLSKILNIQKCIKAVEKSDKLLYLIYSNVNILYNLRLMIKNKYLTWYDISDNY